MVVHIEEPTNGKQLFWGRAVPKRGLCYEPATSTAPTSWGVSTLVLQPWSGLALKHLQQKMLGIFSHYRPRVQGPCSWPCQKGDLRAGALLVCLFSQADFSSSTQDSLLNILQTVSKRITQTQKAKTTERSTGLVSCFPVTETQKTENQLPKVGTRVQKCQQLHGKKGMDMHDPHTHTNTHRSKFPALEVTSGLQTVFSRVHFNKTWVKKTMGQNRLRQKKEGFFFACCPKADNLQETRENVQEREDVSLLLKTGKIPLCWAGAEALECSV